MRFEDWELFCLFLLGSMCLGNGEDVQIEIMSDEKLAELVDDILKTADKDNDGFVSYMEFRKHSEILTSINLFLIFSLVFFIYI
ncbi:hypothetical protein NQ317_015147 [Molorchus minor]|uniref:EF-hand domain-containing protein n=1 Tax=Molorchus minor TaxID=1323400 RepID=A0ABQ9K4X1_9CUCU|nr:hypothetical protein NQ317_015147 [Molorchus minor]